RAHPPPSPTTLSTQPRASAPPEGEPPMTDTEHPTAPKTPEEITADVLDSFNGADDERLREIMQALVRHLHGFVLEVGLSPTEWETAIGVLTRTGHITDE